MEWSKILGIIIAILGSGIIYLSICFLGLFISLFKDTGCQLNSGFFITCFMIGSLGVMVIGVILMFGVIIYFCRELINENTTETERLLPKESTDQLEIKIIN